jgi:MFS family permease
MQLAILDWSSLLYRQLGVAPTEYGVGNVAFIGGVTVALLASGPLADRLGRPRVLWTAAPLVVVGMIGATVADSPVSVAVALLIAGLGVASVHTLALSAAGAGPPVIWRA